ncbi:hypothetical protein M0804_015589 [Polistes exclamans]|nr:hypothetical protein M0804_015589 [Polistes exclamans]
MSSNISKNALGFLLKCDAVQHQSPKRPSITQVSIHVISIKNVVGELKLEERRSPYKHLSATVATTKNKDSVLSRVSHVSAGPYMPRRFTLLTRCV